MSVICNNNLLVEIIYILLFISLLRGRASTQNVSFRDSLQWSIHKFTSSTQLLKLNYLLYYPSNAAFSFRDSLQWPVQKLTLSTQLLLNQTILLCSPTNAAPQFLKKHTSIILVCLCITCQSST